MFKKVMPVFLLLSISSTTVYADTLMSLKDFLKKELSNDVEKWKISKEDFTLDKAMLEEAKKNADDALNSYTFYYAKVDSQLKKACVSVPQKGKEGPLSAGICFTPEGNVASVTVLMMQEDHGKPVKEESFTKQFVGKTVDSNFEIGKDVDAVTGATTSSKAMAEAVRKASFAFKKLVLKK